MSTRWGCVLFISNIQLWILKTGKSTHLRISKSKVFKGIWGVLSWREPCRCKWCLCTLGVHASREQRRARERRVDGGRGFYLFQRVVNLVVILKLWPPLPRRAVSRLLFNFLLQVGDKHPVDGGEGRNMWNQLPPAHILKFLNKTKQKNPTKPHMEWNYIIYINDVIISEETKYLHFEISCFILNKCSSKKKKKKLFWLLFL